MLSNIGLKFINMHITKKISLVLIILGFTFAAMAQEPSWTDYYNRQNSYPENKFLVGFVSGVNTNDEDPGKLKSTYEIMAKGKVLQSIQVEIETNNSLNISNKNGKSEEEFISKSVSFSKANISGLNTQSYYDRKKKEVYAIATVNKKELAFYYRNLIKSGKEDIVQKLTEGRKYVKKGNKESALKSFYSAMPVLSNIDEARTLLIALNRKMYADIDMVEINKLNLELIGEIDALLEPSDLNLSESAYFVAYGLSLQLGQIGEVLYMDNFTYENTGLSSLFSEKWNQEFKAALVSTGNYNAKEGNGAANNPVCFGNYWKEGEFLKIAASVTKQGKLIAVSKGSVPLSWINKENIDYLPVQIKKMKALDGYKLLIKKAPKSIKLGMPLTLPIEVQLSNNSPVEGVLSEGIPIKIINTETEQILCTSLTNELGISQSYLPSIRTENPILRLEASVDLAEYLNIKKSSIYYAIASEQNPIIPISIDLATEKPTIFIMSKEMIQNKPMDILTLEPLVKETFAEKGYNFVDNKKDANFIIEINANTTTGSQYEGIYFAFLDINFSVVDVSKNEEIFKTHLDQIKGGGGNYKKAGKKAYIDGAKKLEDSINKSF